MATEMERREVPVLLSANSLFDHTAHRFREVPVRLMDLDIALDSAGYVAMAHYKRFPWSVAQYVELAMMGGWTWWSQMDCCCEPEVSGDRESIRDRIHATAQLLMLCRLEYFGMVAECPASAQFTLPPMPVLQGWEPDDYKLSAQMADAVLEGKWPDMIGIGSVCRRRLNGPDGLWRVLHALDTVLPAHVQIHLFGVKGPAMRGLVEHPRVVSVDSMAFELHARMAARKARVSKTIDFRMDVMEQWLSRQANASAIDTRQLTFAV